MRRWKASPAAPSAFAPTTTAQRMCAASPNLPFLAAKAACASGPWRDANQCPQASQICTYPACGHNARSKCWSIGNLRHRRVCGKAGGAHALTTLRALRPRRVRRGALSDPPQWRGRERPGKQDGRLVRGARSGFDWGGSGSADRQLLRDGVTALTRGVSAIVFVIGLAISLTLVGRDRQTRSPRIALSRARARLHRADPVRAPRVASSAQPATARTLAADAAATPGSACPRRGRPHVIGDTAAVTER